MSAYPVSTRPLIMGCSALLSVVSQLLSVCNPADSLVRLQRGATPVAACLQAPAELCKAVAAAPQAFGNRLSVFPDRQNHYRPRWRRCAPSASCSFGSRSPCTSSIMQGLPKSATLPLAKKILYVTRPASRSHPGISACRANDTPTIERIINAFVPRKAFCSSALMQTLEQVSGRSPHRFK